MIRICRPHFLQMSGSTPYTRQMSLAQLGRPTSGPSPKVEDPWRDPSVSHFCAKVTMSSAVIPHLMLAGRRNVTSQSHDELHGLKLLRVCPFEPVCSPRLVYDLPTLLVIGDPFEPERVSADGRPIV